MLMWIIRVFCAFCMPEASEDRSIPRMLRRICVALCCVTVHISRVPKRNGRIVRQKRSANNAVVEPLYTMEDADGVIRRFVPCHYNTIVEVCEGVKIRFTDIGHLLGSASIEVWLTEDGNTKKIVFSGDIGNKHQPLLKDPTPTKEADYVVMESTYGDRLHPKDKLDYVAELTKVLQETLDRGGNVVIPSFAVGRTQEILYSCGRSR